MLLLKLHRRGHGIGGAIEFGDEGIAAHFVRDTAVILDYFGEALKTLANTLVGKCFVLLHRHWLQVIPGY